jgi:hypothetical protein
LILLGVTSAPIKWCVAPNKKKNTYIKLKNHLFLKKKFENKNERGGWAATPLGGGNCPFIKIIIIIIIIFY